MDKAKFPNKRFVHCVHYGISHSDWSVCRNMNRYALLITWMSDKCEDNINVWNLEDPYKTDFFLTKHTCSSFALRKELARYPYHKDVRRERFSRTLKTFWIQQNTFSKYFYSMKSMSHHMYGKSLFSILCIWVFSAILTPLL